MFRDKKTINLKLIKTFAMLSFCQLFQKDLRKIRDKEQSQSSHHGQKAALEPTSSPSSSSILIPLWFLLIMFYCKMHVIVI